MARRGGTLRINCHTNGCREASFVSYDSQREAKELLAHSYYQDWKCSEHSHPERYLTPENPANSVVLVATDGYFTNYRGEKEVSGRYWYPEGKTTGSGINFSDAHYVDAKNFPAGTRLVITAYTETPEQAEIARAVDSGGAA